MSWAIMQSLWDIKNDKWHDTDDDNNDRCDERRIIHEQLHDSLELIACIIACSNTCLCKGFASILPSPVLIEGG